MLVGDLLVWASPRGPQHLVPLVRGPPESPWQVSSPRPGPPAQNMPGWRSPSWIYLATSPHPSLLAIHAGGVGHDGEEGVELLEDGGVVPGWEGGAREDDLLAYSRAPQPVAVPFCPWNS